MPEGYYKNYRQYLEDLSNINKIVKKISAHKLVNAVIDAISYKNKMEQKVLNLPLKKKWYDMIESGEKKEEYREIKPYWCNRLLYYIPLGVKEYWKDVLEKAFELEKKHSFLSIEELLKDYGTRYYSHVKFTYGYTKKSMMFEIDSISIGEGNKEWGGFDKKCFIIKLGNRIE